MSAKRKADGDARIASRTRVMKPGDSRADSERDSGFSDASSEHMSTVDTTDSEDSPQHFVQQSPKASGLGPQSSPLAVVRGSYSNLSPMIIMNNVVLKQPGDNPPALKPWGFSPTVEVVQPVNQQPQVVFLQPVVSRRASPNSKEASRHRRLKKYFPILKSYPKIAPHPGDSSSSSGRGTVSSTSASASSTSTSSYSSSSSSCSERGRSSTSSRRDKQQRNLTAVSNSGVPVAAPPKVTSLQSRLAAPASDSSSSSSPVRPTSVASLPELTASLSFTHTAALKTQTPAELQALNNDDPCSTEEHSGSDADVKRKRFCNTYNILSKSGLLDITLRTKELLRQNRRSQTDIDRLKEQTNLFLEALRSGDASVCVKLQAILQNEARERESEQVAPFSSNDD
ncbi:CLOCK-interacting pacemaker [Neosynchiropus ocellatus]